MTTAQKADLVIYSSPFGTPERIPRPVAERRLEADRSWYQQEAERGTLTARQRRHGPPLITPCR